MKAVSPIIFFFTGGGGEQLVRSRCNLEAMKTSLIYIAVVNNVLQYILIVSFHWVLFQQLNSEVTPVLVT